MPVNIKELGVDAVICAGYKWLCGPCGTGFAWINPEVRSKLNYNHAYWVSTLTEQELQSEGKIKYHDLTGARKYDVFGTANFFNFVPFTESINLLNQIGLEKIRVYQQELISKFLQEIDRSRYDVVSESGDIHSSLFVIQHKTLAADNLQKKLNDANIHAACWKGRLRFSPHIYNTLEEVEVVLKELNQY